MTFNGLGQALEEVLDGPGVDPANAVLNSCSRAPVKVDSRAATNLRRVAIASSLKSARLIPPGSPFVFPGRLAEGFQGGDQPHYSDEVQLERGQALAQVLTGRDSPPAQPPHR